MLDSIALKYYRFLRIPSKIAKYVTFLYPLYALLIIFIDLIPCSIGSQCDTSTLFAAIAIHTIHFSIMPLAIKLLVPYMKRRQILNMIVFSSVPGILLELLGSLIGMYGMVYIVLPLLGLLILRSLVNSRKKIVAMLFTYTSLEVMFIIYADRFSFMNTLTRIVMILFASISSVYLNKVLNSYRWKIDIFELSSAWAKYMLTGMDEDIESQIGRLGEVKNIRVHSLLFHRENDAIAVIVPGVHFGPFRTLGSTLLPHYLDEMLNSKGIKTLVLHGAGSHELDLANKNEAEKLANEIANRIVSNSNLVEKHEVIYEPFRVYSELYEALVIQTSSSVIIAVSSPIVGGDDIPYEVQRHAEEVIPMYGFKHAVIIDCHNVEGLKITDPNKFNSIVIASASIRRKVCNSFRVGYGESFVHGNVKGLCTNKVKVLTMDCDGTKYSLIYLYGNNAKIGVRDSLRRIAVNSGVKDAEVVTPDDHICAGIVFDSPYYSVEYSESIVKAAEKALKSSIKDLSDTRVYLLTHGTKVNVVGLKIFELLELAKHVGRFLAAYLKRVLISMHIPLLIVLLLSSFSF